MHPHPRPSANARRQHRKWLIRIGKWSALALLPLALGAWGVSAKYTVSRDDTRPGRRLSVVRLQDGGLRVTWLTTAPGRWRTGELKWWAEPRDMSREPSYAAKLRAWSHARLTDGLTEGRLTEGNLTDGRLTATRPLQPPQEPEWYDPRAVVWRPRFETFPEWDAASFLLPLWIPAALCVGLGGVLWWRQPRFSREGCCVRCGYDLRGLPGVPCPECGRAAVGDGLQP